MHICCSNCALYPVKILRSDDHELAGFWFNPNIHPSDEYQLRLDSLKDLSAKWHIEMMYEEEYKPEEYFKLFDDDRLNCSNTLNEKAIPAFPDRCRSCYLLRLEKTAEQAKKQGFDAFTTTLLISPYQDFEQITETGKHLEEKYNVNFYLKDFRPSFRDAMSLSKEMGLYRQKYCGCIFSRYERDIKKSQKTRTE